MINGSTQADTTCRKVYIEGIPKAFEYSGKRSIGIWRTRVMNISGGTIPEAEEAKLQGYVDGKKRYSQYTPLMAQANSLTAPSMTPQVIVDGGAEQSQCNIRVAPCRAALQATCILALLYRTGWKTIIYTTVRGAQHYVTFVESVIATPIDQLTINWRMRVTSTYSIR